MIFMSSVQFYKKLNLSDCIELYCLELAVEKIKKKGGKEKRWGKKSGDAGDRTRGLSHAKRALYH